MKPLREVLEENRRLTGEAEAAAAALRTAARSAMEASRTWEAAADRAARTWDKAAQAWKLFFLVAFLGGFAGGGLVLLFRWIVLR